MTSDPDEMAIIAKDFWSHIWSLGNPDAAAIDAYLDKYQPQQAELDIDKPTVDLVLDTIISSKNTAAGYDGIPFAAFRALAKYAGPVLHAVLLAFMDGNLPDGDFNAGLLFLLPKKDTQLAKDTRPISVGNTDTRLVAKCLLNSIIGTVVRPEVLDMAQKGSITGRVGMDHVADLSNAFYTAVEDQQADNLYALFVDTRKAFDSVHHDFIRGVMKRKGFPGWVLNAINALLHDVRVTPFFGKLTDTWVEIKRGVKQGCPLSPVLFALCMDPLLRAMLEQQGAPSPISPSSSSASPPSSSSSSSSPSSSSSASSSSAVANAGGPDAPDADLAVKAYVDDIQAYSTSLWLLGGVMLLIDEFAGASGLGINRDKTVMIQAQDQPALATWMTTGQCPWARANVPPEHRLKVEDHYTALGFTVGRHIGSAEVFSKPVEKMRERLIAYAPTLRRLSPTKRYHVYNIFIHPLISYVCQAYSIPERGPSSWRAIRGIAARAAIPFGGTAFGADIAFAPKGGYSVPTPLRDPWATSVSTLAANGSFAEYDGVSTVQPHPDSMRYDSMVKANVADAVGWWLYANTVSGQAPPTFKASTYDDLAPARRRAALYKDLVAASGLEADVQGKLAKWLSKRGLEGSMANACRIGEHFANFKSLPAHVQLHQHYLPLNAVATDERARFIHGRAKGSSRCHLCGNHVDHIDHIHGQCEVTAVALRRFGHCIGYRLDHVSLGANSRLAAAHLLFTPSKQAQSMAITVFNWACWLSGRKHKWTPGAGSSPDTSANRVVTIAVGTWLTAKKSTWREPTFIPPGARNATFTKRRRFGSAGNRTLDQAARARAAAQSIISRATKENSILAFSDGSALGNPGPAGAAAIVVFPSTDTQPGRSVEAYAPLGVAGNNTAELFGNAMVFAIVKREQDAGRVDHHRVVQCSDSMLSMAVITYTAVPVLTEKLAHATRRLANSVNDTTPAEANWVAGHADIALNDHVDELAKRAAENSRLHPHLAIDIDACIDSMDFIPLHCSTTPHLEGLFGHAALHR